MSESLLISPTRGQVLHKDRLVARIDQEQAKIRALELESEERRQAEELCRQERVTSVGGKRVYH
jgi:hypothetical protein